MKTPIPALVAVSLLSFPAALLAQETGVSHPEAIEEVVTTTPVPRALVVTPTPLVAARQPEYLASVRPPAGLDAAAETGGRTTEAELAPAADAGIVTTYPYLKNALAEGVLFRARLNQPLSSKTTEVGTRFSATLSTDISHDGRVIFPAGSMVHGRVSAIRNGKRIGGAASVHLEPESITLADGTSFRMNARVIDLGADSEAHPGASKDSRVNGEGTISRSDHAKATLAALSLTTGSAAAAGAVVGGGVGAVVGAGIGAGVGAVWWLKRDREETLDAGTQLVFSLDRPMELSPSMTSQ